MKTILKFAVATAMAIAVSVPAYADNESTLLSVKWNIGSKVSNIDHRLSFGGVVGRTGTALTQAFRSTDRLHADSDDEKRNAILIGLAAAGVLAWAVNQDDDDDCDYVITTNDNTGHRSRTCVEDRTE